LRLRWPGEYGPREVQAPAFDLGAFLEEAWQEHRAEQPTSRATSR